jgi:hypothetical protein
MFRLLCRTLFRFSCRPHALGLIPLSTPPLHLGSYRGIGGLTFLSLNDIHWQCESTVFGNFMECLKAMMEEAGDWKPVCKKNSLTVTYR